MHEGRPASEHLYHLAVVAGRVGGRFQPPVSI
jgi:hypothetical protein